MRKRSPAGRDVRVRAVLGLVFGTPTLAQHEHRARRGAPARRFRMNGPPIECVSPHCWLSGSTRASSASPAAGRSGRRTLEPSRSGLGIRGHRGSGSCARRTITTPGWPVKWAGSTASSAWPSAPPSALDAPPPGCSSGGCRWPPRYRSPACAGLRPGRRLRPAIGDSRRGCDGWRRHVVPAELTAASEAEGQHEHHDDREAHRDARERRHHDRPAPARDPRAESRPGIRRRLDRPEVVPQAAQGRDRQDGRFDRHGAARTALEVGERVGGLRARPRRGRRTRPAAGVPGAGAAELDHEAFASTSSFAAPGRRRRTGDRPRGGRAARGGRSGGATSRSRAGRRAPRPSPGATAAGGSRGRRRCGASRAGRRSRRGRSPGARCARPCPPGRCVVGGPVSVASSIGSVGTRRRDSRE